MAIERSLSMIVLCSPESAKSRYVIFEIDTFIKLGRRNQIFLLFLAGEYNAEERGFDADLECLPPALRSPGKMADLEKKLDMEMLAADLRPGKVRWTPSFGQLGG